MLIQKGLLEIDEQKTKELVSRKNRIFNKLAKTEGQIIQGVRDFLQMLKNNNVPMAICSGALLAEIELILEQAKLRDFFEVIVSAEQVKKGKPNPEGFLLVLQKLNQSQEKSIEANECIAMEDSHWGLKAARAAGMHTVAVTNSYDANELSMAEKIVARLSELNINALQQLCS